MITTRNLVRFALLMIGSSLTHHNLVMGAPVLKGTVTETKDSPSASPLLNHQGSSFWNKKGREQLRKAIKVHSAIEKSSAKNVILFIGGGMGATTVAATRINRALRMRKAEGYQLNFERHSFSGRAMTYTTNHLVPHCAAAATAIFTGVKTKNNIVGCDELSREDECNPVLHDISSLPSLADWAVEEKKSVGLVTNGIVLAPIVSALYAKIPHFDWMCSVPPEQERCVKDIGRQLIEDAPGKYFKVILGGGLHWMEPYPHSKCQRQTNLTMAWLEEKEKLETKEAVLVRNAQQFRRLHPERIDYLLGLLGENELSYHLEDPETPRLVNMTRTALKILKNDFDNGFLLVVVSDLLEQAHIKNYIKIVLDEAEELDLAVKLAIDNSDMKETLIVVTGDHGSNLGMYGYPPRGTDVLQNPMNNYDTLFYGGANTEVRFGRDTDLSSVTYQAYSAFNISDISGGHSGEDVPVYALGAGASLLSGTYEQSYIGHAIKFVMGPGSPGSSSRALDGEFIVDSANFNFETSVLIYTACASLLFL